MKREVTKKEAGNLKRLFEYAGNHKYLTIVSCLLSAISKVLAFAPFVYIWLIIKEIINVSPNYANAENITFYAIMALVFTVISILIYIGGLMCSHVSAFRIARNIRIKCVRHVCKLPPDAIVTLGSGKIRKIIDESSAATETFLAHQLPDISGAVITPILLIAILFTFDWLLGLVSLIPVVIAFITMSTMTGAKSRQVMTEYNNALGVMSNQAVEYVRGISVVKTFGQTVFSFKKFSESIDKYKTMVTSYSKGMKLPYVIFLVLVNVVFAFLIPTALLIVGRGIGSVEFVIDFIFYLIFTPIITLTLLKIMYATSEGMIVKDALNRIASIMVLKPIEMLNAYEISEDKSISLENISFKYEGNDKNVIDDISLTIPVGGVTALVGPSGGGKTTIAGLISRFWDVQSGSIKIGNVNIKDIAKEDLYNTISYIFQDSKLLKTSIFENVKLGKPDATRKQVMEALELAQCTDIIEKLPYGIDTVVGTKGVFLSGGECQRISIARAMIKDSSIFILDEATAFADPENERKVQMAFEALRKDKTIIIIAHRLSTIKNADCICVLSDGKIIEQGTHDELIAKEDIYCKMWIEYSAAAKWSAKQEVSV